jgi:hypothetical protein
VEVHTDWFFLQGLHEPVHAQNILLAEAPALAVSVHVVKNAPLSPDTFTQLGVFQGDITIGHGDEHVRLAAMWAGLADLDLVQNVAVIHNTGSVKRGDIFHARELVAAPVLLFNGRPQQEAAARIEDNEDGVDGSGHFNENDKSTGNGLNTQESNAFSTGKSLPSTCFKHAVPLV